MTSFAVEENEIQMTGPAHTRSQSDGDGAHSQPPENPLAGPGVYTFWKGRVALYAILKALGVGQGDCVVLPGYTCFAVPSAVFFAGALPIYVDIDPHTFNLSFDGVKAICHPNVKAILVQHTYGMPANTAPIVSWAREQGIAVIEDCAHAWGSRYLDESGVWHEVGTTGDAAFFSCHWTKPISTGLGGWVKVANLKLEDGVRRFYTEECVSPSLREVLLLAGQVAVREIVSAPWAYWMARDAYQRLYRRGILVGSSTKDELRGMKPPDYAKRMSVFQQWLLKRRSAKNSLRVHSRRLKAVYDAALESVGLPVFKTAEYADPVLLRYPVRVSNKDWVLTQARRRWIELGDWYKHPVDQPEDSKADSFGYRMGMCPEGERAGREVVTLPMHERVTERAARNIVQFLKEVA